MVCRLVICSLLKKLLEMITLYFFSAITTKLQQTLGIVVSALQQIPTRQKNVQRIIL